MTRARLLLLPLLLAACTPTPTPQSDDVPTVPRATRPAQAPCALTPAWLDAAGGPARLMDVNLQPARLHAQATPSLFDQLLEVRQIINRQYWGESPVDLQTLHEQTETQARATFGPLRAAALSARTDAFMGTYVDGVHDGHTYFMDAAAYRAFLDSRTAAPTPTPRLGVRWVPVPAEDGAVLLEAFPEAPAAQAGLRRGDTLLSVNGQALNRQPGDSDVEHAAHLTQQLAQVTAAGQPVTVTYRRGEEQRQTTVTPRIISSAPMPYGAFLTPETYLLRLPTFVTPGVADRVHTLLRAAQQAGAGTLILDLRGNGGGLLGEAIGVAGALAGPNAGETIETLDGQDVTYAYRDGKVLAGLNCAPSMTVLSVQTPTRWTGPVRVLVNAGSASASEIVAQLAVRSGATLIGERSYGVGNTVTILGGLSGERGLGVTIGVADDLHGERLKADVTPVPITPDDLRALAHGQDLALQAALK
ncbi:PDZ domain-containing protein [Deinococcus taeanensis]|uniref:S41 family peptidase n=1 Tax=Deinococcus taeanensis TaxID=2737050 RepID=UPI001CDC5178|nr:S41 family peptidase [Deinococcus taeanensis]UBV43014.1 PDZ domain-containing protein [Deinococcus taeanensis]